LFPGPWESSIGVQRIRDFRPRRYPAPRARPTRNALAMCYGAVVVVSVPGVNSIMQTPAPLSSHRPPSSPSEPCDPSPARTPTNVDTRRRLRVGVVQSWGTDDRSTNLERAKAGVLSAAHAGARLVCLQELFAGPYFCQSESPDPFRLAEPIPGPTTEAIAEVARDLGVVVVTPVFERRAPGLYHNSTVVIDADGSLLGTYRKMHIPDDPSYYEKYYFTPGDAGTIPTNRTAPMIGTAPTNPAGTNPTLVDSPRVEQRDGFACFRTRVADIGVLICWDQWYPEAARLVTLLGAEIICYPTAIGWLPSEKSELGVAQREAWEVMHRAHAIANGVFVVASNRVGLEGNIEFWGNSIVCDPLGRVLGRAPTDREDILVVDCDLSLIESTRCDWPFLRDRRIDAYRGITERYGAGGRP
jgi:N-carbamoylputrescine amidase